MMEKLCVVIPMKSPERSKQRLAAHLPAEQRKQLALMLFENTLAFFKQYFPKLDVLVISESCDVLQQAKSYGAMTLFEAGAEGLNDALERACQWVTSAGYRSQMIVPGDIAMLDPKEIQQLLDGTKEHQVVIAVAKDGGTNALLTSPPDAIGFHYGKESARHHQEAARQQMLSCSCLHLVHLSLDIDQSDDLKKAALAQPNVFTFKMQETNEIDIEERQYA